MHIRGVFACKNHYKAVLKHEKSTIFSLQNMFLCIKNQYISSSPAGNRPIAIKISKLI